MTEHWSPGGDRCRCGWRGSHEQACGLGNHYANCPEDEDYGIWIDTESINARPAFPCEVGPNRADRPDPLTDPIPEDQTRLGDSALTLHELARAERKAQVGTVYQSPRGFRRILRALRRPRGY